METKIIHIKAVTTREDANQVIEKCRAVVRVYVQQKLTEYRIPQPVCDLSYGLFPLREGNPYDEIANTARRIQCSLMDGWDFFFEAERLRRELAELRGRVVEVAECKEVR